MVTLLCESDWGVGPAFLCCFSLTLRRCNGGSPVHGAMLFISETAPATFSSRRRSGGVHSTLERAVMGPLGRTVSELRRAQSKDAPDGHKLELCREKNVFLAFLKGHEVLFLWLKATRKKGVIITGRKGGGRSCLCTVCPYTLQKSAISTIYQATLKIQAVSSCLS